LLPKYAAEPGPEDLYPACPNRAVIRDEWAALKLPKIKVPMARGHSEIFEIPEAVASSKNGRPLLHISLHFLPIFDIATMAKHVICTLELIKLGESRLENCIS
jgi:hypothetical protein